jgi:SRSO17 transposase
VWTTNNRAVVAVPRVEVDRWRRAFTEMTGRIAGRFVRVEPRVRASRFLLAMMAELGRVNAWTLAEHAGQAHPRGMQRLLSAASWDTDGVRDDLREYVIEHLGDPEGVLVLDETGDVKKGTGTVGVQRQYTPAAGRIENSQVAVYLVYATARSYAFIDRELYLPKSWTGDQGRCAAAGVPAEVTFATKPTLAKVMVERAVAAGTPAAWVTGDEVYGADAKLRAAIAQAGLGYVLAVAKNHHVTTGIGVRRAIDLAVRPDLAWHRASSGTGAKGHRFYDWALITTTDPDVTTEAEHYLLIRRSIRTGEYAFYRAWSRRPTPLKTLVKVAGSRWKVEEGFQTGKELTALDQHQVRLWISWRRWTVLAMLAHAFLSVMALTEPPPADTGLIPFTRNEIRRLLAAAHHPTHPQALREHWSAWRRRHQATARRCHYQRQAAQTA